MWDRKDLKRRGKAAFKANYWKCVLVGILLTLFLASASASAGSGGSGVNTPNGGSGVTVVSDGMGGAVVMDNQTYDEIENAVAETEFAIAMQDPSFRYAVGRILAAFSATMLVISLVGLCLRLLVFNPLEVGCRGFFVRNTEAPAALDELKTGFHPFGRTVGAMFLRDLFLALWFLLFLIPGLIKHYSYRMVPYILADDPTIGAMEAITLSREMMNGHKWKAFVLDLSFIGWGLLSMLTLGLLGVFYVNPYKYSTDAELYQALLNQ